MEATCVCAMAQERRIPAEEAREAAAWEAARIAKPCRIHGTFTISAARIKMKHVYQKTEPAADRLANRDSRWTEHSSPGRRIGRCLHSAKHRFSSASIVAARKAAPSTPQVSGGVRRRVASSPRRAMTSIRDSPQILPFASRREWNAVEQKNSEV